MTTTRPPRFFVPHDAIVGDRAVLTRAERHHLRVRRIRPGARVELFDDRGRTFDGVVNMLTAEHVEITVTEHAATARESPLELTLAVAPLKADKLDLVVEKATELGVTRIVLFACERALGGTGAGRLERWRRIAVSAAKQCGRSVVPAIDGPVPFETLAAWPAAKRLLCWERATGAGLPHADAAASVLVAVGPEGGFTVDEVRVLQRVGFQLVSLGPRVLRGETAAIAAVTLAQSWWGDLVGTAEAAG